MALVTHSNTHCTDASIACQSTRVTVVPVLLLILFTGSNEGALLLRPVHILRIVCLAVVKYGLLVAVQQGLLALFLNLTLHVLMLLRG